MWKRLKKSNSGKIIMFASLLLIGSRLFAQTAQDTYQKQLLQALAHGKFSETAHAIVNKIQKLDTYEELLNSLLVQPSLSVNQRVIVLRELLLLFEAMGRWTDVCITYDTIKTTQPLEDREKIQYAIALFLIGEYEKSEFALSTVSTDQEYAEYKILLMSWIIYAKSYKTINMQELIQLTHSENFYIKISALQLLTYISDSDACAIYTESIRSHTQTDYTLYSSISTYMLSLSMLLSQKTQTAQTTVSIENTSNKQETEIIILQAGAFSKYENALNFQKKLQILGISSNIIQRAKDSVFLVLIYSSVQEYQTITIQLKEAGIEAWVTNEP